MPKALKPIKLAFERLEVQQLSKNCNKAFCTMTHCAFKFFYRGYGVCRMVNQNFLDKSSVYIKFVLLAGPTIKEEQVYSLHVHPGQAS